jgi:kynurenine formamidase
MENNTNHTASQATADNGNGVAKERRGVTRRKLLAGSAASTAAFFVAHATGDFSLLREAIRNGELPATPARAHHEVGPFDDEPFDPEAVRDGSAGWYPTPYGADDQLGTLNEITAEKVLQTWAQEIRPSRANPPKFYNLGELLQPGVPAFGTRVYEQTIQAPNPGPDYAGENQVNGMEERFATTYHIATQLDGLPHIGVGDTWYNGNKTSDLFDPGNPSGVLKLGQELVSPFITRGLLLDVLSVKVAAGDDEALGEPVDGKPILGNSYRITVEDLQDAMDFGGISSIDPGDIVLIRTGWTYLFDPFDEAKKARFLATEPGIYLREARWLSQFRPAAVGSDTWALEVLPAPAPWSATQLFPVHQELLTHNGIRIAESWVSEGLAADGVYRFIVFYTSVRAKGATAGNVAPGAFGSPTRARR